MLVIVKQHLAHIGRIDGPTDYLSQILAAIRSSQAWTTRTLPPGLSVGANRRFHDQ